ncbi:nucleoside-triphosphatase [Planctomycetota bacterium]
MAKQARPKILLTGTPGCGKTTLIIKLAQLLTNRRMAGFVTEEIVTDGQRTGFNAKTFRGHAALLSSIHHKSWISVGRYGVDVHGFEDLVLPELEQDPRQVDLFLVDEIGKMECFCSGFVNAMKRLLEQNVALVATVSQGGKGLIAEIKTRDDVELITVTAKNRDSLPQTLAEKLK